MTHHAHHKGGRLDVVHSYAPGTTLRCLTSFYIGIVAFRFKDLLPARAAGVLLPLALLLLYFKSTDLWLIAVFTGLIMALSHDTGLVARWLQSRVAYWLGVISFALYLVHDLIQKVIFKSLPAWGIGHDIPKMAWVFISVGLAIGVAALAHYYYEKPSRVWARNLIKVLEARKPVFTRENYGKLAGFVRGLAVRPTTPAE